MSVTIENNVVTHDNGQFTIPETGAVLVQNLTIEDYHALGDVSRFGKNAIFSKSGLTDMFCPLKFKHYHVDMGEKKTTDALAVGNAAHILALEPELFDSKFHVLPDGCIRNEKHSAYQEQLTIANGRQCLTAKDYDMIQGLAKSLANNKISNVLLDAKGKIEASIIWKDLDTGLSLKTRPDFLRDDGVAVDLKTCITAQPEAFARASYDKGYDISVAMTFEGYKALTGVDLQDYIFLAVEKEPPFVIEAYNSFTPFDKGDPSQMTYYAVGEWRLRALLDKLLESLNKNKWNSYVGKITPMSVPSWELKKLED